MEHIEIAGGLYVAALIGSRLLAQAEHWLIWGVGSGVVGGLFLGWVSLLGPELSQSIQADTLSRNLVSVAVILLSTLPLFVMMVRTKPRYVAP